MPYRTLTPEQVRYTAEQLMRQHGATTTLEVKNGLRSDGYWAVQTEVSAWMAQLAQQQGWHVEDTGRFRIYALRSPQTCSIGGAVQFGFFGSFWLN